MKNLDTLYEAYVNYKKLCITDINTSRFFQAYMNVKDKESEDIVTIFSICHIEQDWVDVIEQGLPFIEKAIKEERQFIRNDGEVLPIEKIRKTSKASIQDLAKHANYITHEAPEDAETEVLPDKMLMIQKESDYAIYENRVLYAALVYLKDFVTSRLVTIKEATNTYLVKNHIRKLIDMGSRKININLDFDEKRINDPLLMEKNTERDVIDRLDQILTGILALLKTPLMREVSKVEMVSRPIQKTNILKMNRNFRESLACFEYIANYQGQGFTIEHIEKSLIPYTKQMNEAYTENLILLSFLNYMFANNLCEELKKDYEEILRKREIQKENEILAKLRDFHASAREKEMTINEYLIMFEQGYRILEERNDQLVEQVKEMEIQHKKELEKMQREHEAFVDALKEKHEEEITEINQQNAAKIAQIQEDHAQEIAYINQEHEEEVAEIQRSYEQEITEITNSSNDEIRRIKEESAQEISETRDAAASEIWEAKEKAAKDLEDYKAQFKEHIADMEKENAEIKSHDKEQKDKIAALETEILNNRIAKGETTDLDFATEDAFDKLEQLKADFDEFFEQAWKQAKKQIRQDTLKRKKK